MPRPWKGKKSKSKTTDHATSSSPSSTVFPSTPNVESPTFDAAVPVPIPAPSNTSFSPANLAEVPSVEALPSISVQNKLVEAWDVIKDDPKISDMNRGLHTLNDIVDTAQRTVSPLTPIIQASVAAAEQTDIGKAIKEGIDRFSEGMPVLMNALDELRTLHPFIGVVVLAFKTVYTLQQKRRENDRKVISLYVGMKDMMGVLFLLKDVENDKLTAPDGISIEDRLKSLVERTADDIKSCSNVCDTYMKKRLLAKVLLSSVWDARLVDFVQLFALRRQEFEFELTMHTSQGVDKANSKLDFIGEAMKALDEKINGLKAIFPQLASTEEKRLLDLVDAKGGVRAFRDDDKMLLDLEKTVSKASSAKAEGGRAYREQPKDANFSSDELRSDIFEDPNTAAEKNWVVFSRKFEAQKNQIIDELSIVVQRESDRVIRELKGSAHERIRDRSIHEIWVEMGWRGNVKARHFVLALRDYYLDISTSDTQGTGTSAISSSPNLDAWAMRFIDVAWIQPILEAFDDDASGFINIAEVNRFTSSRPVDWSLPHWLAFWAVGFRTSIVDYAKMIEDLFAKMEGIRAEVLPPNREMMDYYFTFAWGLVHTLTAAAPSLLPLSVSAEKFKPYLEAEEARLSVNLKAVNYIIDGSDTLSLITGMGRIEKVAFPLLYLLMKRHYEIMRVMRTKIPDPREIYDSEKSIRCVYNAVQYRVDDLTNIFSHQRLDLEKQFQDFAFGIFKYFHDGKTLFSVDSVRSLSHPVMPYDDANEDQNVEPKDVLNYEYKDEQVLDYWVYDGHSISDIPSYRDVGSPLKDILGHWHGYSYEGEGVHWSDESMATIVLEPGDDEQDIKGKGWSCRRRFKVNGSWSKGENDIIQVRFKMSSFETAYVDPFFFNGRFDPERDALTGVWRMSELETSVGPMEFRRIPPHYLTAYPTIKDLAVDKPRALWKFAIAAVRNDIGRESWSWSYFSQRRDDRDTILSLAGRYYDFGTPLSAEEINRMIAASKRPTSADACFYESRSNNIRDYTWVHRNAYCDSCGGRIGGARLFCLDCVHKTTENFSDLDLCCLPQCVVARITHRNDLESAHEPDHRLLKARIPVLVRHYGRVYSAARRALERIEDACAKIAESSAYPLQGEKSGLDEQGESNDKPSVGEMPAKIDKIDDALTSQDGTRDRAEAEDDASRDPTRGQDQDGEFPTCGKCNGRLSFPCWYCIFCEDDLFICDACDRDGVPDLMRSSGKHTEDHHLIRCRAPEKNDDTGSSTEQRLLSVEGRIDGMQAQLDDLTRCTGDLNGRVGDLAGRLGDQNGLIGELTGTIGALTSRIGEIELLLHRLTRTTNDTV